MIKYSHFAAILRDIAVKHDATRKDAKRGDCLIFNLLQELADRMEEEELKENLRNA